MSSKTLSHRQPVGTLEFTYPPAPPGSGSEGPETSQVKQRWAAGIGAQSGSDTDSSAKREQLVWAKGVEAGKAQERAMAEQQIARLRSEIEKSLVDFSVERDSYFHRVEEQVVRLVLVIVRKILHRESQVDPLLLTGVLRVALEKLGANTKTRLRTNPGDVAAWRDYFAQSGESVTAPELIADSELHPGRCVLETELGTTEIGLETQLKEIEQGFLDLLAQRPGQR